MTEASPYGKRRRITAAVDAPKYLTNLPSGILAHAASFLAAPSKALFAVALDENSGVTCNERSTAIVGNQWDVLDFGAIEKELAAKLLDSDIEKVLLRIDAINHVKRLKLTNCTKITGVGLEPLRGSTTIEQIDLSLVGDNQNPNLDPAPSISCEYGLPILDSIITSEGCELEHLQFPAKWHDEPSSASEFHAFLGRYNQMLRSYDGTNCFECNGLLPCDDLEWINFGTYNYPHYGTQNHTCYGCLKHYCYVCVINEGEINGEEKFMLSDCSTCKRDYCADCLDMTACSLCERSHCNDCYEYECQCHRCNKKICSDCDTHSFKKCEYCQKSYCSLCNEVGGMFDYGYPWLDVCDRCHVKCCDDCRLQSVRQGQQDCIDCIRRIAPLLVGVSLAQKQLQEENEQLKVENEELKSENKELKLKLERS